MRLHVNNVEVEVPAGSTVLDAAAKAGVTIPTMCHMSGKEHFTSCMICLVKNKRSGRLIPACSARVEEGLDIDTVSEEVMQARRDALALLLSEHAGDCQGPCRLGCPARVDITAVMRSAGAGDLSAASATLRNRLALASVVERVCSAPCERTCRRGLHDSPVAIRALMAYAADYELTVTPSNRPIEEAGSGKSVAIVGGGPAGLSTAWHLRQRGHECTVMERGVDVGGRLRTMLIESGSSTAVLDQEVEMMEQCGITFKTGAEIGRVMSMADVESRFDAVVLAMGVVTEEEAAVFGVEQSDKGIRIDRHTFQSSRESVFAVGQVVAPGSMVARTVGDGLKAAIFVDQYLRGKPLLVASREFNSRLGKLADGELAQFVQSASKSSRLTVIDDSIAITQDEAEQESRRCFHCDCRKAESCKLRDYATEYEVRQSRGSGSERLTFAAVCQHSDLVYEPGKCIKCGICVRITADMREPLGLAFVGRGFDARVAVPFDASMAEALTDAAEACVEACPTGALAKK